MHEVLFTPFVTVNIDPETNTVATVEIDWSDTLRNVYSEGREVWEDGHGEAPITATKACSYLDAKETRERVLAAFQPNAPALVSVIERLKADLEWHQNESARITRDVLDIDTAPEGAYSIEDDCAESYHEGRVNGLADAIKLLLGEEVKLYSETEQPA